MHFLNIVMMLFSFAGSIAKSHGPKFLYTYFGIGHVTLSAATLGLNYVQIKEVGSLIPYYKAIVRCANYWQVKELKQQAKGEKQPE